MFLSTSLTLGGYTVDTFGTAEAAGFCVVVLRATGASNCTVTGASAAARRQLLTVGVVVGYTLQTTPAAASNVTTALLASAVLSSAAAFQAAGLAACTGAVPSTAAPTTSLAQPVVSATLPATAAASSAAWRSQSHLAVSLLVGACLPFLRTV